MTIYETGGRGRKQCPQCKKYIASVVKVCDCGEHFDRKEKPPVEVKATVKQVKPLVQEAPKKPAVNMRGNHILAAAGPCPHKLTGTTLEAVQEWRESVEAHFKENGDTLGMPALISFVNRFYQYGSDEHTQVLVALAAQR